jgi:hypothetical protein
MRNINGNKRTIAAAALTVLLLGMLSVGLDAHGVSGKDAVFLRGLQGRAIGPLLYLGAKHMVTGYDHLLFLVGVIFFLYRLKDVLLYVSLFTLGHSVTLLLGVLGGVRANPFLIDAIIGFSVVYKAFENMDGFRRFVGVQPNTRSRSCSSGFSMDSGSPPSCRISRSRPMVSLPTSSASTWAWRLGRVWRSPPSSSV